MSIDKLKEVGAEQYLIECVDIDPIEIDEEFLRQPSDLAYWHERYAQALRRQLNAKHNVSKVEADVQLEIRDDAIPGTKLTDVKVKAMVASDMRVVTAYDELAQTEADKARCKGYSESVASKGNMLQSIGAKLRLEMKDPAMREQIVGAKL